MAWTNKLILGTALLFTVAVLNLFLLGAVFGALRVTPAVVQATEEQNHQQTMRAISELSVAITDIRQRLAAQEH